MPDVNKKKILIVEDDRALQNALVEMLGQEEKYDLISAVDGEEGLAKAISEKPDLILLDIILPKKDGYEVLADIKKNPEIKDIPVLILTNLEEISDVQRAISLGAKTFMVKSDFSLKDVLEKVRESLK
jgi:CheY-like chemotaxis protein